MQRGLHGVRAITPHFHTRFSATLNLPLCQDITPYRCHCYRVALRLQLSGILVFEDGTLFPVQVL